MNILFTRFPLKSAEGGAENQTTWLWEGLRQRGHVVSFLGSCPVLLRRARALTIKSEQLTIGAPPVTKWSAISFFWRRKLMRMQLIEAIEKIYPKPEAIVMLSLTEKLLLTEWVASKGIKVFWVEHDRIGPWLTRNPWLPHLKRLSAMAMTVCVSSLSRRKCIDLGWDEHRVVAIPNGVPAASLMTRESHVGLQLGCIARLSPEKGVDVLLGSIRDVPNVELTIVGQGPEEGFIRKLIEADTETHGTPRVHLINRVENIEKYYESIDVLVLPSSDHDPFGLAAAEALMRGLPVIVTDQTGIAGYLQNRTDAIIAEAGSEISLQKAILSMLDPLVRSNIGESGMRTAREKFSLEKMVDEYVTIFASVR